MSATVTSIDTARKGALSPGDRLQALLLAQMNEEKAELCTKAQAGIREFLLMNAKFLHEVAKR
jgi:hypothetical protein